MTDCNGKPLAETTFQVYTCEEKGGLIMTGGKAELLASVIIARSSSFVFNKLGLGTMAAIFNMLAVRFLVAFAGLMLIFGRRIIKRLYSARYCSMSG